MVRAVAALLVSIVAGCGGKSANLGGDAGQGPADASSADAGWTQCTAPGGLRVCGGPAGCAPSGPCTCTSAGTTSVGVCAQDIDNSVLSCRFAVDGDICVNLDWHQKFRYWPEPFDLGALFAKNGFDPCCSVDVLYADFGQWTGAPLPAPAACPTVSGITLCGGPCGACAPGEVCTGRSPQHPFSHCVASDAAPCRGAAGDAGSSLACPAGQGCFTYDAGGEPWQSFADYNGVCFPIATCTALAAQLPGGGTCTPGP